MFPIHGLVVGQELLVQGMDLGQWKTPVVVAVVLVDATHQMPTQEFRVVKVLMVLLWLHIQILKTLYKPSICPSGDPWRVL